VALLAVIVCIPPLIWHSRNKNLPAACLIIWFLILNLFNFTNSLIWPTDNIASWWDGHGFCDIHTKLMAASGVGVAGALVCIFRSLAKVMDTDRTTLIPSKAQRRRNLALDIMLCIVFPIIMMFLHYVVQDRRYRIQAIIGCDPPYHTSWASTALAFIWPPIELFVATIYCGMLPNEIESL
jgi:pheromone a factor receptor